MSDSTLHKFFDLLKRWLDKDPEVELDALFVAFGSLDQDCREMASKEWSVFNQLIKIEPFPDDLVWNQILNILYVLGYDESFFEPDRSDDFAEMTTDQWEKPLSDGEVRIAGEFFQAFQRYQEARGLAFPPVSSDEVSEKQHGHSKPEVTRKQLRVWRIAAAAWFVLFLAVSVGSFWESTTPDPEPEPAIRLLVESKPDSVYLLTVQPAKDASALDVTFRELMSGINVDDTGLVLSAGSK